MCDIHPLVVRAYLRELERQATPQPRPVPRAPAAPGGGLASLLRHAAAWPVRRLGRRPARVAVSRR
jgi:hypothetical protein